MKAKIVKGFQRTNEIFVSPGHKSIGFFCLNVIVGSVKRSDLDAFFGPLSGEEVFLHLEDVQWATLLKTLGIFPSSGQARKNGWDKEIPIGWSEASFKNQRKIVFVFRQPKSWWTRTKEKLWADAKRCLGAISRRLTVLKGLLKTK